MSYCAGIALALFCLVLLLGGHILLAFILGGFTYVILDAISDTSERR